MTFVGNFLDLCNQDLWDRLLKNGYFPLALDGKSKAITRPGWTKWTEPGAYIPGCNIGIRTGSLSGDVVCIDGDITDPEVAAHIQAALKTLARFIFRVGAPPKFAAICRMPGAIFKNPRWTHQDGREFTIQILADGAQFVGFGIHPGTKEPYFWDGPTALDAPVAELPLATFDQVLLALDIAFAQIAFARKDVAEGLKTHAKPFMTDEDIERAAAWARRFGEPRLKTIESMGPKTGRGTKAFELGSAIAIAASDELVNEFDGRLRGLDEGDKHAREFRRGLAEPIDRDLNIGWRELEQDREYRAKMAEHYTREQPTSTPPKAEPIPSFAAYNRGLALVKELGNLSQLAIKRATTDKAGGQPNKGPAVKLARDIAALVEIGAATVPDVAAVMTWLISAAQATNNDVVASADRIEVARLAWADYSADESKTYADALRNAELTLNAERAIRFGQSLEYVELFDGTEVGAIAHIARHVAGDADPTRDVISAANALYRFDGMVWAKQREEAILGALGMLDGSPYQTAEGVKEWKLTAVKTSAILTQFHRFMKNTHAFAIPAPGIMLKDGFLVVGDNGIARVEEPRRDHYCLAAVPYTWAEVEGATKSVRFERFLHETFDDDPDEMSKVMALQEGAASAIFALHPRLGQRAILWLLGAARAGKGVFMEVLDSVIPAEYSMTVDPRQLGDNRFYSSKLAGKRLLFNRDTDVSKPITQDILKRAIDCEPIDAEVKYANPTQFTPSAQWILASNEPPRFAGGGDSGMASRIVMVRFNNTRELEDRDRGLAAKIIREDGAFFLNWALRGATRMASHGWNWSPDVYRIGQGETNEMFAEYNPVLAFFRDKIVAAPGNEVDANLVYASFVQYAEHRHKDLKGIPSAPVVMRQIGMLARRLAGTHVNRRKTDGKVFWVGFSLRA
jgi:phage/plasmid-associated DNA primase